MYVRNIKLLCSRLMKMYVWKGRKEKHEVRRSFLRDCVKGWKKRLRRKIYINTGSIQNTKDNVNYRVQRRETNRGKSKEWIMGDLWSILYWKREINQHNFIWCFPFQSDNDFSLCGVVVVGSIKFRFSNSRQHDHIIRNYLNGDK